MKKKIAPTWYVAKEPGERNINNYIPGYHFAINSWQVGDVIKCITEIFTYRKNRREVKTYILVQKGRIIEPNESNLIRCKDKKEALLLSKRYRNAKFIT